MLHTSRPCPRLQWPCGNARAEAGMGGAMELRQGAIVPFDGAAGIWLRCALHTHTTESDGWLSPAMLRRYHAIGGYDVLAITDHDRYTPAPESDDDLLLLGGVEL